MSSTAPRGRSRSRSGRRPHTACPRRVVRRVADGAGHLGGAVDAAARCSDDRLAHATCSSARTTVRLASGSCSRSCPYPRAPVRAASAAVWNDAESAVRHRARVRPRGSATVLCRGRRARCGLCCMCRSKVERDAAAARANSNGAAHLQVRRARAQRAGMVMPARVAAGEGRSRGRRRAGRRSSALSAMSRGASRGCDVDDASGGIGATATSDGWVATALVAPAEDGLTAVLAVERRAAGARRALVAGSRCRESTGSACAAAGCRPSSPCCGVAARRCASRARATSG